MSALCYKFGPFRLYQREGLLLCGDEAVSITPKCFKLLFLLVDKAGHLLENQEILNTIWPDTIVEPANLNYQIHTLRKTLNNLSLSPHAQYIETVSKRGFRFTAKVVRSDSEYLPANLADSVTVSNVKTQFTTSLHLQQLQAPVPDFVGRGSEIEELVTALRNEGGVSTGISGMGGIGKSELALLVCDRLRTDYPDGQVLVNLRGSHSNSYSPSEALIECIVTLSRSESRALPDDTEQLAAAYRGALVGKRMLIILDDAAGSEQIRYLSPPRGSALIVTSRNTFTLPSMKASIRLEQLNPSEARQLLTIITPRIPPTIADDICSLCGYLPLAIRAASSLLAVSIDLSPAVYSTKLRDERTRLGRFRDEGSELDVEASLNLSYDRLEAETARVFRQLAVFPGSFDAIAEETVCEDEGHVQLSNLVRRSLVTYDKRTNRYSLHDLMRLLAIKYLDEKEADSAGLRHAEYYQMTLLSANKLFDQGGKEISNGLELFDLELENIKAGQRWAQERAGRKQRAAELCNRYPIDGSDLLELRLHPRERVSWRQAAVTAARKLRKRNDEGKHLGYLGEAYRAMGEIQNAVDCHSEYLSIARETGDRDGERLALMGLGNVYDNLGEMQRALECNQQALAIAREIGNRVSEGKLLGNIGITYWRLGRSRRAIECHEEHLVIARETGDRLREGYALGNLGLVSAALGDQPRAIALNREALFIFRELGDRRSEGDALGNIGKSYASLGELKRSLSYFKQELSIAREIGNRALEAEALMRQGESQLALGKSNRSLKLFREALRISQRIQNRRVEADISWKMSQAFHSAGDDDQAVDFAEQALNVFEEIGDPSGKEVLEFLEQFQMSRV